MQIKIIFQKIGNFFLHLFGYISINLLVSFIAYMFGMTLWAFVGEDKEYATMQQVSWCTAIAVFAFMSLIETLWHLVKLSS